MRGIEGSATAEMLVGISGSWEKRRVESIEHLGSIGRRSFARSIISKAVQLIFGIYPLMERTVAAPRFSDNPFNLGIASGDPLPDGVVLWTRLAPEPLAPDGRGGMPEESVPVRWEVAADETFRRIVRQGTAHARPELAHSVHVEVEGLEPAREYYYRFKAGSEVSPVGRTKTAPALGNAVAQMRFAFASCQMYEHGYYTAYGHMSEEDLDLVVHLGDYIYEYGINEYVASSGNVRRHDGPKIFTLPEYRNRYALYRSASNLRAAHAAFPWVVTWDDHEVENNYADGTPGSDRPVEEFLRRRTAAYQAYYEHMPLRRSSLPQGPDMLLHRRIAYGNLAQFNVLDTRQYRDDQAAGGGVDPPNPEQRDPRRSITGEAQQRWLFEGLSRSRSRWNVLAQQVFFAQRDLRSGPGESFAMDAWDGYLGSRNRTLGFIAERRIRNPIVISGDVHNNWVADLKVDFNDPNSQTVGTEFVGTSITSGGDGADTNPRAQGIVAENPHIRFFNGQRGYVRCVLTPQSFRADYRVVPYVSQRGAPIHTRASFEVADGQPGAQRLGGESIPLPSSVARISAAIELDHERMEAQERADGEVREADGS
jgi:alkaline phosphatase D